MSDPAAQDSRTATQARSIWRDLPEDSFRNHLVALEQRTNAVPVKPQVFPLEAKGDADSDGCTAKSRLLSLEDEHRLANDLAYIAAVGEGAQSVSAVCIEECWEPPSVVFRFAAIDAISPSLQNALEEIARTLSRASRDVETEHDGRIQSDLFDLIVRQHYQKLLGRLRSIKWQKPKYLIRTHKKSLWQDFENLIHRVQFVYPKPKNTSRRTLESQLRAMEHTFRTFEEIPANSETEFVRLQALIRSSYMFCTSTVPQDYARKLEALGNATPQISAAIKSLRQIEKIAACWRIVLDLTRLTRRYPALFQETKLAYLGPYQSVETTIGFESWAKSLHVHAEVQLAVHYDLTYPPPEAGLLVALPDRNHPRIIGTSKHLCYLCYRFLVYHGRFMPSNTHGRLYDQWTLPDLREYDFEMTETYRKAIENIDRDVSELSESIGPKDGKRETWRAEPMTSRENLLLETSISISHETYSRTGPAVDLL